MTARTPPDGQPAEDDTALLIAALNHAWCWYDAQVGRGFQVINYFLISSTVLGTAYVSAVSGKHYAPAAVVALAGIGLSAIAFLMELRQIVAVLAVVPVLGELQHRVAGRLKADFDLIRRAGARRE